MTTRPALIVFGNCQAQVLAQMLEQHETLSDEFEIIGHEAYRAPDNEGREQTSRAAIICVQAIQEWDAYPFADAIPAGAQIVRFPYISMTPLWPFDCYQTEPDPVALEARKKLKPGEKERFPYHDSLLAKLRSEIPPPAARFEAYASLKTIGRPRFDRQLALERFRAERVDRQLGTNVCTRVHDQLRNRRLFHTVAHPTIEVIGWIADELLEKLGVPPSQLSFPDYAMGYQVPVHPVVAEALGIKWIDETTLYYAHDKQVTFADHVREYIEIYG